MNESVVAFTTPATEAPVSSSTAARNRNSATMWAPTTPSAVEIPQYSPSPTSPPRGRTQSGSQRTASPPGPSPSVPAARPSVKARNRHSPPDRNGRTAGSISRMTRIAPAASSATGTTRYTAPISRRSPSTAQPPASPPSHSR